MRSLATRISAGVWATCVFFALVVCGIGAVGIAGVQAATHNGEAIASDQLATSTATARFSRDVDLAHATGQALALTSSRAGRDRLTQQLTGHAMPAVDADLAAVQRLHAADSATEWAGITELARQWADLRSLLSAMGSQPSRDPASITQLTNAFTPLDRHVQTLLAREEAAAQSDQTNSESLGRRVRWNVVAVAGLAVIAAAGLAWAGGRVLRRALEPAQDQVEFADTLQLAEDETEAHHLLQRHLERTVAGSTATILNRNNSADRLEAVTALAPGSPLVESLQHAEPRSCLAVRSGQVHDDGEHRRALLGCAVCSQCPGLSTCTPLTVGGEVIGSVLVTRKSAYNSPERQRIRESVGQAAPVLANLRNLAIAELRAATDSLTGLPNKRAVSDTLKRMLAQASRTMTPMSLLMLDLDHFRDINERFGHPAGDQALANVGSALRSVLRDSDFAGRNGGEEFAVILPDTDLPGAAIAAESIRAAIAEITVPGADFAVTASVGVATFPDHALTSERLERLSDSALYVAKKSGRNRIEIATQAGDSTSEPPTTHSNNGRKDTATAPR